MDHKINCTTYSNLQSNSSLSACCSNHILIVMSMSSSNNVLFSNAKFDPPSAIVNATGFTTVVFQCIGTSNTPAISESTIGTAETLFDCDLIDSTNPGVPPCERSRQLVRCDHFGTFATEDPITAECPSGSLLRIATFPSFESVIATVIVTDTPDTELTFGPISDFDGNLIGDIIDDNILSSVPGVDTLFTVGGYGSFIDVAERCGAWSEPFYYDGELTSPGQLLFDELYKQPCSSICPISPESSTNGSPQPINNPSDDQEDKDHNTDGGGGTEGGGGESSNCQDNIISVEEATSSLNLASDGAWTFIVERPEVANALFDLFIRCLELLITAALAVVFYFRAEVLIKKGVGIHPLVLEGVGGNFSFFDPLKSRSVLGGMIAFSALLLFVLESTMEFGFQYRSVIVSGDNVPVWDCMDKNPQGAEELLACQVHKNCASDPLKSVVEANTAVVSGSTFFTHAPFGVPIRNLGGTQSCLFGGESTSDTTLSIPRYRPRGQTVSGFRTGGDVGIFQYCERNVTANLTETFSLHGNSLDTLLESFLGSNSTRIWGYVNVADNDEITSTPSNVIKSYEVNINAASEAVGTDGLLEGTMLLSSASGTFNTLGSTGWYSVAVPSEVCVPSVAEYIEWYGAETEDGRPYSLDLLLKRSEENFGTCVVSGPVKCVHDVDPISVNGGEDGAQCLLYAFESSTMLSEDVLAPALSCAQTIAETRDDTSERSREAFMGACILALSGQGEAPGDQAVIQLQIQLWLWFLVLVLVILSLTMLALGYFVLGRPSYHIPVSVWQGYEFGLMDSKISKKRPSSLSYNERFTIPTNEQRVGILYCNVDAFGDIDHLGVTTEPKKHRRSMDDIDPGQGPHTQVSDSTSRRAPACLDSEWEEYVPNPLQDDEKIDLATEAIEVDYPATKQRKISNSNKAGNDRGRTSSPGLGMLHSKFDKSTEMHF